MRPGDHQLPVARLLSVIKLQNQVVADGLDLDDVIAVVLERAHTLTGWEVALGGDGSLRRSGAAGAGLSPADEATLALLSEVIAAHLARCGDGGPVDGDGRHDELTGLRNRRAFDERLESELARARRHGGQFALCLLELDALPGHEGGEEHEGRDSLLRAVAAHLSQVRGEDAAYRLGGVQFALVLVEASGYGATAALDRVWAAMSEDPACRSIGISSGVATFQRGDDAGSMLARADAALYRSRFAVGTG